MEEKEGEGQGRGPIRLLAQGPQTRKSGPGSGPTRDMSFVWFLTRPF